MEIYSNLKRCNTCKIEKPWVEFNKCNKNKDRLQYNCKTCRQVYRQAHKGEKTAYDKVYYQDHKEEKIAYRQNHKEERAAYKKVYERERRKTEPDYKLVYNMRIRFNQEMKGITKTCSVTKYLGCTKEEAWAHIESLMSKGMTKDDWGRKGMHIDHIIPLVSFDMRIEADRYAAWHYTNLQPLWAKDNLSKGSKTKGVKNGD